MNKMRWLTQMDGRSTAMLHPEGYVIVYVTRHGLFRWEWSIRQVADNARVERGFRRLQGSAKTKGMIRAEIRTQVLKDREREQVPG